MPGTSKVDPEPRTDRYVSPYLRRPLRSYKDVLARRMVSNADRGRGDRADRGGRPEKASDA